MLFVSNQGSHRFSSVLTSDSSALLYFTFMSVINFHFIFMTCIRFDCRFFLFFCTKMSHCSSIVYLKTILCPLNFLCCFCHTIVTFSISISLFFTVEKFLELGIPHKSEIVRRILVLGFTKVGRGLSSKMLLFLLG
jgi:hypothetical protein